MGLLPSAMDGGLSSYEAEKVRFVQTGKKVSATVTAKLLKKPRISYRYQVAGRAYEGGAFVSNEEWVALRVGGPVEVVYDPKDPAKSDYRPEQWLHQQDQVKKVGHWIVAVGVVGLVVCSAAALGRRAGFFGSDSILARLVTAPRVVGAVFFGVAMAMQANILVQHFGKGMVWQVNEGPPHIASGWEVLGVSAFLAIFWGVGLALMVFGGRGFRRTKI